MVLRKNATVKNLCKVEFRSIFRAPSQNFKILAISNVLTYGKSYEHSFMKKCDGHKFCTTLSFDRIFTRRLRILKYCPFPTY
ncbi:hypothetical protein BHE74_00025798 [Ensete ventricosum]|nr:hypothetical protein GW17_00050615 [Ensete ventricosum]RWW66815.1 hypothetical protein BHE74_00025798 [Ensete ventricosum]RZR96061.1 hypothetical protein BHM03_00025005 [Ensete ventricosum]